MNGRIYVDHAATTPVHPDVLRLMLPLHQQQFGNPSSLHQLGREAQAAIDTAREQVAAALNARTHEILFTSGGSESINTALKGVAFAQQFAGAGRRIVTTPVEHHAALHTCDYLERFGFETVMAPVDGEGRVDPEAVAAAVDEDTALVNVMLANNEVGTVQPIAEIAAALRARGTALGRRIPLHTDAVQAPGQLPLDVRALDVDLVSLSAHKFGGPKGVGALYLRRGTPFLPQQSGGGQERNRRAGTENVAGIAGLGLALSIAERQRERFAAHTAALRDHFFTRALLEIPDAIRNGPVEGRLPNNVNVRFDGVDGQALLEALDAGSVEASSGSACTTASWEPSHVLLAMGVDQNQAAGSLRCTFGLDNTVADIDAIVVRLREIVARLRQHAQTAGSPAYGPPRARSEITGATPFLDELAAIFPTARPRRRRLAEDRATVAPLRRFRGAVETVRGEITSSPFEGHSAALVRDTIRRLTQIAAAYDADTLEESAAGIYDAPDGFRGDLALVRALAAAPGEARQILAMRAYAAAAALSSDQPAPDLQELAVDQSIVLERLSYSVALEAPQQIEALSADFELFRRRYQRAYLEHHRAYHAAAGAVRTDLEAHRSWVSALAVLNGIDELGPSVGADLEERLQALLDALPPCGLGEQALRSSLATNARCPECGLAIADQPPSIQAHAWTEDCRRALHTQQRRLARAMVARAIEDGSRPAFERFLRAVGAGDVAPLVEVMDGSVAALIREVLAKR